MQNTVWKRLEARGERVNSRCEVTKDIAFETVKDSSPFAVNG